MRKQTHMLMQLCIRATAKPGWYDTTPEEICAYLGCSVCMGIIRAPAQDLYWSKDKLFHLSCIEERFTRTRFENIQIYFHLTNTTQNPPRSPSQGTTNSFMYELTVKEIIRGNFNRQYNTHIEVSIDEAMIRFSGWFCFKQYVPLNPYKKIKLSTGCINLWWYDHLLGRGTLYIIKKVITEVTCLYEFELFFNDDSENS